MRCEDSVAQRQQLRVRRRIAPLILAYLIAARIEPQHIFYTCTFDWAALKKTPTVEYRMPLAQADHSLHERQQVAILRLQIPVQPTCRIVLAIRVVVSQLRMTGAITRVQHRYALGQQQRGQEIPLLLGAQSLDVGIFRGTLCSAIPAEIIVVAIPILFAVGFIVFFVLRHPSNKHAPYPGSDRSIPSIPPGSFRPDTLLRRGPRVRRSALPARARDPDG